MNILYTSVQCSEEKFIKLFQNSTDMPGQQAQKYNRLLAEGLSQCDNTRVYAMTAIPVTKSNYPEVFLPPSSEQRGSLHYHYLSAVNLHRVRDILTVATSFFYSLWAIPHYHIQEVIADVLAAPAAFGSLCAAQIWRKPFVGVITDVPDILFANGDRAYHLVSNYVICKSDRYILLTEQMRDFVKKQKPYVVIEGIVENVAGSVPEGKTNPRIVMYSGTIHKQYGIQNLTEGFLKAEIPNAELHIYGEGDYRDELLQICREHTNIRYFGTVLNTEMVQRQKNATLLVNPRSGAGEFTKYSFPSKNMEYMLSGVPVLAQMLPGMPEEYRTYIYELKDASAEGIGRALQQTMNRTAQELSDMGMAAQKFVLREKNQRRQAEKVLDAFKEG